MLLHNSKRLSKMLINGTSLRSPHSLETESKLKDSLFVCSVLIARCHIFYPPLQMPEVGIWITHSSVYFNCFSISKISIEVDYYGGEIGRHSSFPMNFFAQYYLTFYWWVDYNIMMEFILSSREIKFCVQD